MLYGLVVMFCGLLVMHFMLFAPFIVMRLFLRRQRLDVTRGEADLPLRRIDLDDARADSVAGMERLVEFLPRVALHLGHVREAFHAVGETNEQTEVGDLRDLSDPFIADVVHL